MYCSAFQYDLILCLLFCFQHVSLATPAPGYTTDLRIAVNDITINQAVSIEYLVYTSIVEYDFDTSAFTDDEIAGLVQQAWEEMKQAHEKLVKSCPISNQQRYLRGKRPLMMSAIAVGKQIVFASSIKQNTPNVFIETDDATLTRALAQCRADSFDGAGPVQNEDIHARHGNCGEIVASALHLALWGSFPWQYFYDDIRVVAYGQISETIQNPCLGIDLEEGPFRTQRIGCSNWVEWSKMRPLYRNEVTPRVVTKVPSHYYNPDLNWLIQDVTDLDSPTAT